MNTSDVYYTIEDASTGEFKDRGSKFFGYLKPIQNDEDFNTHLSEIKSLHLKARHHCFAFRLFDTDLFRYSDDGEPSGTAGKPIYNQIVSNKLVNCSCIVVRYFGGTKLGTSGLINAYKESAKAAISKNQIVEKYLTLDYLLKFDYSIMGSLMQSLKQLGFDLLDKSFDAEPTIRLSLRKSKHELLIKKLKAHYLNRSIEDINDETQIDGLKIIQDPNFSEK